MLERAVGEFARCGLKGTTTEAIAARCGFSQPYLFRLFGSKGALFLAVLEHGFDLLDVGEGGSLRADAGAPSNRLRLMRRHDGELAKLFLQGCAAACDDEEVAALLRRRLRRLATQCGRSDEDLVTEILRTAGGRALREAWGV
ncbi:TetR/AcrR family transcriptional regulator [Streptomyces sp. H39-C1]|uniref:TetR/AcrR family transcriptional regulator n=1 Tax=Streptomyces sp. H39-C1 TaxID=3004355 RepID=UPI0022B05BD0|nr:helix-turn-helix domain-containing protein [Streptomyces sp. H39-C1]MCZ4103256.1 helix-turn-helix domain containing protein [Streptomyces sp. H39-C1]